MRACAAAGVPWVARGSGSGLSGGALPLEDGVLIVTSRMKRVLEVDLPNQRVVRRAGRHERRRVERGRRPTSSTRPIPSSQIVCSIGGNVAENSGGAHCFKYGFTTNYVCGLEVVLPDGELIMLGGPELDPPGYDLLGAFVGSEGTLGHRHEDVGARAAGARDRADARRVLRLHARGGRGGVGDRAVRGRARRDRDDGPLAIEASEQMAHAGYPIGRGAALLVELDGAERECATRFDEVVAICERCGSDDVRVARDEAERQLFWKTRKAAFPAMGRIAPNYFVQDGVIPRTTLPEVLERIDALAQEYDMVVANVFHAGDGNLHPLVCFDGRREGEAERAEELSGLILDACLDAGGSITGEHGVGVDKKKHMPKMFERGRPRRVPAAALRLRPRRAREPRQGDADAAAVRRGARPLPPAPARSGRPGGAVLRPATRRGGGDAAADARRAGPPGATARRRDQADWGPVIDGDVLETGGLDRILEHNAGDFTADARGRRAAGRGAGGVRRARARCSRSTRALGGAATIGGVMATERLRAAPPPLRRACATSCVGVTVALSDGTLASRAAR